MTAATKGRNRKYGAIEKKLLAQKAQLTVRMDGRIGEVHIDREPDDGATLASNSSIKDMAAVTLERERRTVQEIEGALKRIKSGEYGLCASCDKPIPDARLKALPCARVCVRCAEQGSGSRSTGLTAD
jgi:RNA polymerase-binding transcription factor